MLVLNLIWKEELHWWDTAERGTLQSHAGTEFILWQIFVRSIVMTTELRNSISCPCYRCCWVRIESWHSICCLILVCAVDVLGFMPCTWYSRCKHKYLASYCVFPGFPNSLGGGVCRILPLLGWFCWDFPPPLLRLVASPWWQRERLEPEAVGRVRVQHPLWDLPQNCVCVPP